MPLLWIIALSLLVYAVVSKSDSGSGPSPPPPPPPPPTDLPAIPEGAFSIRIIGRDHTLCSPTLGGTKSGVTGDGFIVNGYTDENVFARVEYSFSGCQAINSNGNALVNNTWVARGGLGTGSYAFYSSVYTLQQLIDYFLSDYTEDLPIEGTLSTPVPIITTADSITIECTKNFTAGNNIDYSVYYTTDPEEPFQFFFYDIIGINNTLSATITGLTEGETYYFTMNASNLANGVASDMSAGIIASSQ